ncbi:MAG: hypothetical protein JO323_15945 [Acidobacteriia bacterium]|nr:hypothetical protein [Terriglobia bacterium]
MPTDLAQAQRMVDLFTSVGATRFIVTNTDINDNLIWPPSYLKSMGRHRARREDAHFTPRALQHSLAHMLSLASIHRRYTLPDGRAAEAGENLMLRPMSDNISFVQLDDLNAEQLDKVRQAAFLIHRTSPGNHQAWLAVADYHGEDRLLYARVLEALGAGDHSATGCTRIAGSENWKEKYLPFPPMISIVEGAPGRVMTPDKLTAMGLLKEPDPALATDIHVGPKTSPRAQALRVSLPGNRTFPSYEMALAGAPRNATGTGPDRSKADYWWCYLAAQRGFSVNEIMTELERRSPKAQEMRYKHKDEHYAHEKAKDATVAWQRAAGPQRSRAKPPALSRAN